MDTSFNGLNLFCLKNYLPYITWCVKVEYLEKRYQNHWKSVAYSCRMFVVGMSNQDSMLYRKTCSKCNLTHHRLVSTKSSYILSKYAAENCWFFLSVYELFRGHQALKGQKWNFWIAQMEETTLQTIERHGFKGP